MKKENPAKNGAVPEKVYILKAQVTALTELLEVQEKVVGEQSAKLEQALRKLNEQIHQLKLAEGALRESETKYKTVYETSADAIMLLTPEKGFFAGNPAAIKIFECRDEKEFTSQSPASVSPEYQPDGKLSSIKSQEAMATAMEKGSHFFEWTHKTKKGREFFTTVLLTRLEIQNKKFLQATVRDITERKRAEEALRERVKELNCLYAIAGLIEKEDSLEKILQGSADVMPNAWFHSEIAGVRIIFKERQYQTGNFRKTDWRQSAEIKVAGQPVGIIELCYLEERTIRNEGPFLKDELNLINAIAERLGRVAERKQAEEKLNRYATDLKRANEEVKEFAYIVSHDLRAPLVNIKGFAAELQTTLKTIDSALNKTLPQLDQNERREVTTALQQDIPEALAFIDSSATHMDSFINSLLKLSRMGYREMIFEPLNLAEIVKITLEGLAHQLEERRAKVTVGPLPEVTGDRTAIEQIVGNLLSNAVKYLDLDRPGEIEITGERNKEETTLVIRDNGRGIAKEDTSRVFMPFRRFGRQDTEGEGMGLAFAHTLVHRHGGDIRCKSESGAGTTFTVTLSNHPEQGV